MSVELSDAWPEAPWESPDGAAVSTAELRAFTDESGELFRDGSPQDYYLPKWRRMLEGRSDRAGLNGAALLVGHTWCFWRKQWLLGLCVILAEMFLGFLFIVAALIAGASPGSTTVSAMPWLGVATVRLWLTFNANRFYLRRAFRAIAAARREALELGERVEFLERRGGTSVVGVAVGLAINFASLVLVAWPTLRGAVAA